MFKANQDTRPQSGLQYQPNTGSPNIGAPVTGFSRYADLKRRGRWIPMPYGDFDYPQEQQTPPAPQPMASQVYGNALPQQLGSSTPTIPPVAPQPQQPQQGSTGGETNGEGSGFSLGSANQWNVGLGMVNSFANAKHQADMQKLAEQQREAENIERTDPRFSNATATTFQNEFGIDERMGKIQQSSGGQQIMQGLDKAGDLAMMSGNPYAMAGGLIAKGANTISSIFVNGAKRKRMKDLMDYYQREMKRKEQIDLETQANSKSRYYADKALVQMAEQGGKLLRPSILRPELSKLKRAARKYKDGGALVLGTKRPRNIIPSGPRHSERNNFFGGNGIPILENGRKIAEVEREEIIFHTQLTNQVESLSKQILAAKSPAEKAKLAQKLGKLTAYEVIHNTDDKTEKFFKSA